MVGAVLVVALTWLVGSADVPYVQMDPGPTYNTVAANDSVISITGTETSKSEGQLLFVTVRVRPQLTLLEALRGWWDSDSAVVPRELVYPPDKTEKEVEKQNAEDFARSESSAQLAALAQLGFAEKVAVDKVTTGAPADGVLKPEDIIVSIDGTPVTTTDKLLELIRAKPVGTRLTIEVTRDGKPVTAQVATVKGEDGNPRVGIVPKLVRPHPFTVKIPVEDVGGPSAGLMLSLGIIDKLDPVDLTGGKIIAGTGSIDEKGAVGPIGGVAQKVVAAKRDGAAWFLTPKANCAEAVANAQEGLPLVQVSTLTDAVTALKTIREGGQPQLCTR
ncbi:PDZ domain-containing protein [Luedemannella flava]|uniref:endopeptidase La n=1 Tax=Luedemannella flava TaxID=349316 RepID=A0ABP4XPA8_9ACTN